MKYAFIERHRHIWPISLACETLGVSPSGYHERKTRELDAQLKDADPWPWAPTLFRIQRDVVEPRLEEAVLSNRDAKATLDEARLAARNG